MSQSDNSILLRIVLVVIILGVVGAAIRAILIALCVALGMIATALAIYVWRRKHRGEEYWKRRLREERIAKGINPD